MKTGPSWRWRAVWKRACSPRWVSSEARHQSKVHLSYPSVWYRVKSCSDSELDSSLFIFQSQFKLKIQTGMFKLNLNPRSKVRSKFDLKFETRHWVTARVRLAFNIRSTAFAMPGNPLEWELCQRDALGTYCAIKIVHLTRGSQAHTGSLLFLRRVGILLFGMESSLCRFICYSWGDMSFTMMLCTICRVLFHQKRPFQSYPSYVQ